MTRRPPFALGLMFCLPLAVLADEDPQDEPDVEDAALDEDDDDDEELDAGATPADRRIIYRSRMEVDFDDLDVSGGLVRPQLEYQMARPARSMSATVGGAQDARFMDRELGEDIIPRPEHFTAEGILSEHDLPVADDGRCDRLLCASGQALVLDRDQRLLAQPNVDALAQIGFTSGLDAEAWRRPALNLVAVVDASGSMDGEPMATTKAALRLLVRRMEEGDRMSIVRFQNHAKLLVSGGEREQLMRAIDGLEANNATCLACGLDVGRAEALRGARGFEGLSRMVVFTDEQPNVGDTSAQGFQRKLASMADEGVGVTTIGVASHFGVELAQAVSTVRGANLFYFEDLGEMRRVFDEELDTMLVPLAYGLELELTPSPGWSLAGLYGLPGEAVDWTRDGGIRLEVATLFPSRDKGGGIFLGFERDGAVRASDRPLATVRMRYESLDGESPRSELALPLVGPAQASLGLQRGVVLVDAITTMKAATVAHHDEGDDARAWRLLRDLEQRLDGVEDEDLRPEWERAASLLGLIEPLVDPTERRLSQRDPVSGLPRR
jgi:Ca-activated chloride channel family protein